MTGHLPVMLAEVMLAPRDEARYLDATFGGGGYTAAILDSAPRCTVFAMDRDPDAIARGAALAARHAPRLHLIEGRFGDRRRPPRRARRHRARRRGDGFGVPPPARPGGARLLLRLDGPLDMRMERDGPSAADIS